MEAAWPFRPIQEALINVGTGKTKEACARCRATLPTNVQFRQDLELETYAILTMWIPEPRPWHYKDVIPSELVRQVQQLGCMFLGDHVHKDSRTRCRFVVWCNDCEEFEFVRFLMSTPMKVGTTRDIATLRHLLMASDDQMSHLCHTLKCPDPIHSVKERAVTNRDCNECLNALARKSKSIDKFGLATVDRRRAITEAAADFRNTCTHSEKCFPQGILGYRPNRATRVVRMFLCQNSQSLVADKF
jgi:hypothetical protein